MSGSAARLAALDTLRAVRRGRLLDGALQTHATRESPRDIAWLHELVYGTLRLRARLDHVLAQSVHGGLSSLEADVLDVLRLGAYQLLEMGGVPDYAAVSQAVELAKQANGPAAASLVNAVLRSVQRKGAGSFPAFEDDPLGNLTTWGSHPRWLVERWIRRWGAQETRRLVERDNERPDVYVRPIGMDVEEARVLLASAGIETERAGPSPDTFRLGAAADVRAALSTVPAVVQDPAAALVVRYADLPRDGVVADLCAAPGGKALAVAGMRDSGLVAAGDVSVRRLARLRENAQRPGAPPVHVFAGDARRPPLRAADAVLLDVPCTGTGTLRRHPDARWRIGPDDLAALVLLQREILEAASCLVRPDGILVYATCSLEEEENGGQVDAFLEAHPEFEPAPGGDVDASCLDAARRLFVRPQEHGTDGAFAARMRRTRV